MGEAKRRKKLDPNFGKNYKLADLSLKSKKKFQISSSFDFFDSDDEAANLNRDNGESVCLTISCDYEVECITDDNNKVLDSGWLEFQEYVSDPDYEDNASIFSRAYKAILDHFYDFKILKAGFFDLSEVSVKIKNINCK